MTIHSGTRPLWCGFWAWAQTDFLNKQVTKTKGKRTKPKTAPSQRSIHANKIRESARLWFSLAFTFSEWETERRGPKKKKKKKKMKGSSSALLLFSILILMISSSSQDSSFKGIVFYKFLFSFICLRSHSSVFVVDLFDCPENIIIGKLLSRLGCRVITYIQFFFFFF